MWQVIAAIGLLKTVNIIRNINHKKIRILSKGAVLFVIIFNVFLYLHQYYVHYSKQTALDWQDGMKETVEIIARKYDQYKEIYVSDTLPPLYIAFYLPFEPAKFHKTNPKESIGKIKYFSKAAHIKKQTTEKALIIAPLWQEPPTRISYQSVKMINGDIAFIIWED
jgi:hypothetical protein